MLQWRLKLQQESSISKARRLWRAVPGPVKLAWLVFALIVSLALGIIAWAVVEVVFYLT